MFIVILFICVFGNMQQAFGATPGANKPASKIFKIRGVDTDVEYSHDDVNHIYIYGTTAER